MSERFDSFSELAGRFALRASSAPALLFEDMNFRGHISRISYPELALRIREEEGRRREDKTADYLRMDHSPVTLIRLFADLCADRSVVLLDPLIPPLKEELVRRSLSEKLTADCCEPSETPEGKLVFFTSGTTHSSRAVLLSQKALLHAAWRGQMCLPIGEGDTLLAVLPLFHVFGFVCSMLWGLCSGAAVALGRGVRHLLDDPAFFRPTVVSLVPTLAKAMSRFSSFNPELKTILIGAAPLKEEELKALREKSGAAIYTGYGLTETASGVAITEDTGDPFSLRVCPGVDLKISKEGEILIRTDSLLEKYIDILPEKRNKTGFSADPRNRRDEQAAGNVQKTSGQQFSPLDKDGFFRTGDLGLLDSRGRLAVIGRKKDVLILPDGTKVFCPEYETALTEVLGTEELAVAQLQGRVILLVSGKTDPEAAENAVSRFNNALPRSRQIAKVVTVNVPLPRTATGKLRRWLIEEALRKEDYSIWKQ